MTVVGDGLSPIPERSSSHVSNGDVYPSGNDSS